MRVAVTDVGVEGVVVTVVVEFRKEIRIWY